MITIVLPEWLVWMAAGAMAVPAIAAAGLLVAILLDGGRR